MSAQYLLPCSCGQKVRVDAAQAGGLASCGCGKSLPVPTLRALRQLETAEPDSAARKQREGRSWSKLQGAMFSLGLIVACISLGVLFYNLYHFVGASEWTVDQTPQVNEFEAQQIDQFSLTESVEAYTLMRDGGLNREAPPIWVVAREVVEQKRTIMLWSGGIALAGFAAAITALFIRPGQKTHR